MMRETKKSSKKLRMQRGKYTNANAITLIALIITIIIMLILVAVTISILVKSNIIGIGEQAADKTKTAYEKESNLGEITIDGKTYGSIEEYIAEREEDGNGGSEVNPDRIVDVVKIINNNKICVLTAGREVKIANKIEGNIFTKLDVTNAHVVTTNGKSKNR